ncbi:unnamed protein product [Staurois parvus]|uniref:Uncharacterized protein n=1 Tax=Staurois parvus TaxID=386267 RepID=A0ABN9C5A1_9NEOB|nr:unnamed protein product [Staurois parvus]
MQMSAVHLRITAHFTHLGSHGARRRRRRRRRMRRRKEEEEE